MVAMMCDAGGRSFDAMSQCDTEIVPTSSDLSLRAARREEVTADISSSAMELLTNRSRSIAGHGEDARQF